MKCLLCIFIFCSCCCFAEEALQDSHFQSLAMTTEEMVFASKLSDANRRRFCYQFSTKERLAVIESAKSAQLTADEAVEKQLKNLQVERAG